MTTTEKNTEAAAFDWIQNNPAGQLTLEQARRLWSIVLRYAKTHDKWDICGNLISWENGYRDKDVHFQIVDDVAIVNFGSELNEERYCQAAEDHDLNLAIGPC